MLLRITVTFFLLVSSGLCLDQCTLKDNDKTDCGVVGSTQQTCEKSGCCWQPSSGSGIPWCYFKKGETPSCPLSYTSKGAPFTESEVSTMRGYFMKNINIQGSGGVVAAPDHNTPGGSYYYHWERDGALSMEALVETSPSVSSVQDKMSAYAGWVSKVQAKSDPHSQSVLTEPKYMLPTGDVFTGAWCRPQNDGPGLRAKTLIGFANAMESMSNKTSVVSLNSTRLSSSSLWTQIRTDLDWLAANWETQGCDLWEEIRSNDLFWDRFTMRAALSMGAKFASKQGDAGRSSTYASAAAAVEKTLGAHYKDGYVYETTSQGRLMDAAVICAFNDGYLGDGMFSPTSKEVAGTIQALNKLFCASFPINVADTKAGTPGILYGRYKGDGYAGGNPWILLSAALAQLLYRGAAEVRATNAVSPEAYTIWRDVLGLGVSFDAGEMAQAMAGAGDGVMMRIRKHVEGGGFHLTEQLDKNTGKPMSAKDLTWSYATVLKAMHSRSKYYADAVERLV